MNHDPYNIGLGQPFLFRAKLIFAVFILLTVATWTGAVAAEQQTGDVKRVVEKPGKDFIAAVEEGYKEASKPPQKFEFTKPTNVFISTSSATVDIKINTKTSEPVDIIEYDPPIIYNPPPIKFNYDTKSFEQAQREQDKWWKSVREANARKSQESQQQLDQFRQESLKRQEEFKKQADIGFEEFRKQGELDSKKFHEEGLKGMEEFKKKYGF